MTLSQVLAEPIGLLLRVDDIAKFRADVRQAKGLEPKLERLQVREVNWPDGNVALVQGEVRSKREKFGSHSVASLPREPKAGQGESPPKLREQSREGTEMELPEDLAGLLDED